MIITIITLLLITKLLIINKNKKLKNLPPSPPSLPIIGHLHLLKKPLHRTLAALADRYGPIFLLNFGIRRVLVVSSPSVAEECFTTNDLVFANRPNFPSNKQFTYNHTTFGSIRYGPLWRNFRRISTVEALSAHRLHHFSDVRIDEVHALARELLANHSKGVKDEHGFVRVAIKPLLSGTLMNVMMRMITGKRYFGEGREVSEAATRFIEIVQEMAKLSGVTNLVDYVPILRWVGYNGVKKRYERCFNARDELLQDMMDEFRRRNVGESEGGEEIKKKTMMENMLELQKSDAENYSDDAIKALTLSLLAAGTSTSSDTIEWAMSRLMNHPNVRQKLKDEIDEHVGNKRILDESDFSNLPYLQCVINETLRLHPPVPLLLPHESSEECMVYGYDIPRETILLVNAHYIQRDPKVWDDPLKFKPERFEDEGKTGDGSRWMVPFGMGRRKCLGEGLAAKVVGLTLGTLIQCFEWDRVNNVEVDMTESVGVTSPKAIPLEVMCCPRSEMTEILSKLLY